jgi:hypothetical protein
MYTTLNAIRDHGPCAYGWAKLLHHLGKTGPDDEPLAITTILDSNGLDDALWALRAVEGHDRVIRLLAVGYARQVEHLMADPRSRAALDVAERHANGEATDEELAAARGAAGDAARDAARDAAMDVQEARLREVCEEIYWLEARPSDLVSRLMDYAAGLFGDGMGGELGENTEYERGIAELICEVGGYPIEDKPMVIKAIHNRARKIQNMEICK